MDEELRFNPPPKRMRLGLKVALVGAGVAAGAIGATAVAAGAQSASSGSAGTGNAPGWVAAVASSSAPPGGHGGAAPVRSDEKSISARQDATLQAEAMNPVPGGTVYRLETHAGAATYAA